MSWVRRPPGYQTWKSAIWLNLQGPYNVRGSTRKVREVTLRSELVCSSFSGLTVSSTYPIRIWPPSASLTCIRLIGFEYTYLHCVHHRTKFSVYWIWGKILYTTYNIYFKILRTSSTQCAVKRATAGIQAMAIQPIAWRPMQKQAASFFFKDNLRIWFLIW